MKKWTFLILLFLVTITAFGQIMQNKTATPSPSGTTTPPAATPAAGAQAAAGSAPASVNNAIIVIDYKTKLTNPPLTPIPFNRRFYLKIIDSVPVNNIRNIFVYTTSYSRKEGGKLVDKVAKGRVKGQVRSSFELRGQDTASNSVNNTITLLFPPIKPELGFDILIRKEFSLRNLNRALAINKFLDNKIYRDINPDKEYQKLCDAPIGNKFQQLIDSANNIQYNQFSGSVMLIREGPNGDPKNFSSNPDKKAYQPILQLFDYKKYLYDPVKTLYDQLEYETNTEQHTTVTAGYWTDPYLTQDQITPIGHAVPTTSAFEPRVFILEKILKDPDQADGTMFKKLLLGYIGVDYNTPKKYTDQNDFPARIKNLTATCAYLDSLNNTLLLARAIENSPDQKSVVLPALTSLQNIRADALQNLTFMKTVFTGITSYIMANSDEAVWVLGNTKSPDLVTLGSRRFTINAGISSFFTYDNLNRFTPIFKFTLSGDYYFTSIDKNIDFSTIKQPPPADSINNHFLESRYTFWQRFALSLGATYGAMSNKSFDNVYGNFSFTGGFSFVITHGLKVGAGVAWLKRYDDNPLMALQEQNYFTPYVSASVDEDVIGVLANLTSALFK